MFKDDIVDGSTYVFENFLVGSNDNAYRTTEHKYKLNFMGGTRVFKITLADIPTHHFKFMSFVDVVAAAREDKSCGQPSVLADLFPIVFILVFSYRWLMSFSL